MTALAQANNEAISPCTARSVAALLADTRATHCLVARENSGQVRENICSQV